MDLMNYLTKGLEYDFNRCYARTIKALDEKHTSIAAVYNGQLENILKDMEIANELGCEINVKGYNEKEQSIKSVLEGYKK